MNQINKIPATVRILTLCNAKVLRRALESVKDFEEILVFDGNSTDGSPEIAKEYNARIEKTYPERDEPNVLISDWSEVVNRVVKAARHDWIFYIDADESAPQGLIEEIRDIVSKPEIDHYVYQVPNRIVYKGRVIKHAISYPGYQPRLFNRKCGAVYEDSPHYNLVYDHKKYPPGTTKNTWYVYLDSDDTRPKRHFIILTAMKDKNQTLWQFFRWSIFDKLFGIFKITVKAILMYGRYGFKDSIPPRFVLAKIHEKAILFWYLMKQRLVKPLKPHTKPPEQYFIKNK